jgi:phosphate acetyltransferase
MALSKVSALEPPQGRYDRLLERAKQVPPATTIVVHPCDESSLRAVIETAATGIIVPILRDR